MLVSDRFIALPAHSRSEERSEASDAAPRRVGIKQLIKPKATCELFNATDLQCLRCKVSCPLACIFAVRTLECRLPWLGEAPLSGT